MRSWPVRAAGRIENSKLSIRCDLILHHEERAGLGWANPRTLDAIKTLPQIYYDIAGAVDAALRLLQLIDQPLRILKALIIARSDESG